MSDTWLVIADPREARVLARQNDALVLVQVLSHEEGQAARAFAGHIAYYLRRARADGRMARLVLHAEPHFLGLLRAAIDPKTSEIIVESS